MHDIDKSVNSLHRSDLTLWPPSQYCVAHLLLPHMQPTVMLCAIWKFSFRIIINLFSNLTNSSSPVGLDHSDHPSLPTCSNKLWPPITLSSVYHFWLILTTENTLQEPFTRAAALEMLFPSHLAITIWSDSQNILRFYPGSYTLTLRLFTCC